LQWQQQQQTLCDELQPPAAASSVWMLSQGAKAARQQPARHQLKLSKQQLLAQGLLVVRERQRRLQLVLAAVAKPAELLLQAELAAGVSGVKSRIVMVILLLSWKMLIVMAVKVINHGCEGDWL
jgi:hypothetical protein